MLFTARNHRDFEVLKKSDSERYKRYLYICMSVIYICTIKSMMLRLFNWQSIFKIFLSFIHAEGSQSEKPHHQAVSHCLPTHPQPIRLVHLLKWAVLPTHSVVTGSVFTGSVVTGSVVTGSVLLEVHLRQYSTMKVIFLLTEEVVNTYKSLPCDYEQPFVHSWRSFVGVDSLFEGDSYIHKMIIQTKIYTLSLVDQILQNAGIPEVFIHQPSLL